jgi:hypothetical protein
MFAPLMVLLEIDVTRFAILELEGDAPRAIDVDRIASRIEPVQRMKIEAWDVHFLSSDGDIQTVEPCKNAFVHFYIDLRTLAPCPQFRKGFVLEGPYHTINVSN